MEYLKTVALRLFQSGSMGSDMSPLDAPDNYTTPIRSLFLRAPAAPTDHLRSPASSSSYLSSASSFWMSRPWRRSFPGVCTWRVPWRNLATKRRAAVLACILLAILVWISPSPAIRHRRAGSIDDERRYLEAKGGSSRSGSGSDPVRWLQQNSNDKQAIPESGFSFSRAFGYPSRPRAALISLVRNSELQGIMQSMRQLEFRWNHKYQYPWVFFNDEPFTPEFKVSALTGYLNVDADGHMRPPLRA